MSATLSKHMEAAERVIEQSIAADREVIKLGGANEVTARIRIEVLAPLLRAIAREAEMATDREVFADAIPPLVASILSALSGYLGADGRENNFRVASLLGLQTVALLRTGEPAASFCEATDREKRGATQ